MSRERPPLDPEVRRAATIACASGMADMIAFVTPRRGLEGDMLAEFGRAYAHMKLWERELEAMGGRVDGKIIARAVDRLMEENPPPSAFSVIPLDDDDLE